MRRAKELFKFFIMMLSEIIWIYYVIVLFTSAKWDRLFCFEPTWFMAAGVVGCALNYILVKCGNQILLFAGNISVLGTLAFLNWRNAVPPEAWGFGIAVSVGLGLIFMRSARLAYRRPLRREILQHFEVNIVLYLVLALVFTANEWSNGIFHLLFIVAILSSLLGMILSLDAHGEYDENQQIKVLKVGKSGWFAGAAAIFFILIPILSLAFLMPAVQKGLFSLVSGFWEGVKWLFQQLNNFMGWLASLWPKQETGLLPPGPPEQGLIPPGGMEETVILVPSGWLMAGVLVLAFVVAIWLLTKFLAKIQLPKTLKPKSITVTKQAWWAVLKKKLQSLWRSLSLKWRMSIPYFYCQPVYWYYHQVLKWGRKNGLPKAKSETSREYVLRLIACLPETDFRLPFSTGTLTIPEALMRLNQDYQAAYYGRGQDSSLSKASDTDYKFLIEHLRHKVKITPVNPPGLLLTRVIGKVARINKKGQKNS
ncbi:MAG: DUF4129 domain-containing protein [Desulfitobacteriia bacterium]|jgi:hypothetical protein